MIVQLFAMRFLVTSDPSTGEKFHKDVHLTWLAWGVGMQYPSTARYYGLRDTWGSDP